MGAIYLDFNVEKHGFLAGFLSGPGFQVAEKFLINVLEHPDTLVDMTALITDDGNYKSKLRNYMRRMKQTDPIYNTTQCESSSMTSNNGLDMVNNHYYGDNTAAATTTTIATTTSRKYMSCITTKNSYGPPLVTGYGSSEREAEHNAARDLLILWGVITV